MLPVARPTFILMFNYGGIRRLLLFTFHVCESFWYHGYEQVSPAAAVKRHGYQWAALFTLHNKQLRFLFVPFNCTNVFS